MISADEARALINRQSYKEKIKEYEEKIEKNIVRAAKNNESIIVALLEDEDPLFQKALYRVLENLTDNGFGVGYSLVNCNKCIVTIMW